MVGKLIKFDDRTWALVHLLRRERRRSFQRLADEAFKDFREKHHIRHPVSLKDQQWTSAGEPAPGGRCRSAKRAADDERA